MGLWISNITSVDLLPDQVRLGSSEQAGRPRVSIMPALVRTYGASFLFGSILKLLCDLLNLASPKVMKLMINFVESHSEESPLPAEHEWRYLPVIAKIESCG